MAQVVIDTNILVVFLTEPSSVEERRQTETVTALFSQIETGSVLGFLPEVVLHETFYTLLGKRFPNAQLETLGSAITEILSWPGWIMDREDIMIYVRAIEILQVYPKLEFSDSVIAARAEAHGATLATFDKRLAKAYSGPIWGES